MYILLRGSKRQRLQGQFTIVLESKETNQTPEGIKND
jgi:hypothetical protein